ncbi:hypothetical protein Y1Q_0011339 [Alligator mississippiensis]|uniref:Uncharacterized protein n=1 Tax=Alligator mississippiensis TaxID=8496 RepID=A0A151N882_ALLMI|nr:hypothetical protein Y1Q_0011339 [Alligator mississippiensis]
MTVLRTSTDIGDISVCLERDQPSTTEISGSFPTLKNCRIWKRNSYFKFMRSDWWVGSTNQTADPRSWDSTQALNR